MTVAELNKIQQKTYIPDASMRKFIKVLLTDEEVARRPYRAEKKSGVDRNKFYYELRVNPEFRKWYLNECQLALDAKTGMVDEALFTATQQLDTAAMRTFYELQGRVGKQNGKNGNGGESTVVNLEIVMAQGVEVKSADQGS